MHSKVTPEAIIVVNGLVKSYGDGTPVLALNGVDLIVAEGEFVAISGPSGSGKTTLLNVIGTLDLPTSGRVVVKGTDIATLSGDALADFRRQHIGFIFQLFNLVPELTALENVMLPLLPYRPSAPKLKERARDLLVSMGMRMRLDHLPGQLSGGEQQRVAIARALINRPDIVLADEPTGNLDSKAGAEVIQLLSRTSREARLTVVLVTHNPTVATQADRVVVLQDGQVVNAR